MPCWTTSLLLVTVSSWALLPNEAEMCVRAMRMGVHSHRGLAPRPFTRLLHKDTSWTHTHIHTWWFCAWTFAHPDTGPTHDEVSKDGTKEKQKVKWAGERGHGLRKWWYPFQIVWGREQFRMQETLHRQGKHLPAFPPHFYYPGP